MARPGEDERVAAGSPEKPGKGVIRLQVPCSLEYRDLAMRLVSGACDILHARERDGAAGKWLGDPDFDDKVISGFGEAFTNVVVHSGRSAGEDIEIEIEAHADHLTIRLKDHGRPFALSAVPAPDLDALPESGMGVYIMKSWMDDVSYAPGSPNVLSMTKNVGGFSRSDDGEETVLRIEGVLDAVTAPDIRPTIEALVAERRRSITVDLSSLRLIDSSGVGVIVSLFKRCKAFGGAVRVSGLKDQPLSIFKLLRLDRVFDLR
jgi:anti-anti-sigma factor